MELCNYGQFVGAVCVYPDRLLVRFFFRPPPLDIPRVEGEFCAEVLSQKPPAPRAHKNFNELNYTRAIMTIIKVIPWNNRRNKPTYSLKYV